jgi:NAD(P)-dependent dehydrogenase (short-subunit alcohol dehydrogenase family)
VTATLAGLAATGSAVRYHAVDIRDAEAIGAVVADVYARHGRLDGVIHGAGVSDDRLMRDKAPDAFARVFETKVAGARNLADALRPGVRFFVLFGSVSGVFGNKGQADYSAANDALDTMAAVWRHRLQTRVVAVDWGPWSASAGGMVTPALEAEYRRRGIATIDPAAGVAALLSELAGTHDDRCQVLYTSSLGFAETGPGA